MKMIFHSMGKTALLAIFTLFLAQAGTVAASSLENGIIRIESHHDVETTANRLEALLKEKNMHIFARIDHGAGAKSVNINIQPAQLLIFGNPKIGSVLMQCNLEAAIDLPQKVLIWKAKDGQVWLSYNNPAYLSQRHELQACQKVLNKVSGALKKFTTQAAQ